MNSSIEEDIRVAMEKLLVGEMKWKIYTIDLKRNAAGENFMGVITKITVRGLDKDGEENHLNFVVKSSQKDEDFRKSFNLHNIFRREIYVYTQVFPTFESFQKEKGVKEISAPYPKFYKHSLCDNNEYLVMENMNSLRFCLHDRKVPLDYQHASLVVKQYGRWHALSYALRDQKPELFRRLTDEFKTNFFNFIAKDDFNDIVLPQFEDAIKILDPHEDSYIIESLKKYSKDIVGTLLEVSNYGVAGKYGVVVHGDCWINNILYKYDDLKEPRNPTQACFIDWQLSCLGSPALDLSYFLFTSTDSKLREQHFESLLKQYHESLSLFLNDLGSDAKILFPWEIFKDHMRKFSIYGLMLSISVISLMLADEEEAVDFSKMSQEERVSVTKGLKKSEAYEERMRGLLRDFCKLGYF